MSFNSILVQLEAHSLAAEIADPAPFQFHIGAIRRVLFSHGKRLPTYSFNSILVQLEDLTRADLSGADLSFQFHIGAIRR